MHWGLSSRSWLFVVCLCLGLGCAARRSNPARVTVDAMRPAPLGAFASGIEPVQTEDCTVAQARACFDRALTLWVASPSEDARLRALSLMSKACDGQVKDACAFLAQHVREPQRIRGGPPEDPVFQDAFRRWREGRKHHVRVACRLVRGGTPRQCVVEEATLPPDLLAQALASVEGSRYELPTMDGAPFECTWTIIIK
ncbi:hypothetical protein DRW03_25520 [Corallococcus sp. H22C18031201]|uniref:hypothetical protein n=1 Tax=Citreicoccus inhibens TaxID=2849499 RepID=UPI000E74BD5C|nr:hypothetical protein [Citreicoccus inhibens]MBU8898939.1 hypothetical protein [Citreicoccus inhibens]RJS18480.1 hypothetical protein DRW03_25520 [Corallococcus sp. H22C18031201]